MEVPKQIEDALEVLSNTSLANVEVAEKIRRMLQEIRDKDRVCLFKKSLYDLRQARSCWNEKLTKTLQEYSLKRSSSNPCVFYKGQGIAACTRRRLRRLPGHRIFTGERICNDEAKRLYPRYLNTFRNVGRECCDYTVESQRQIEALF